MDLPWWRRPGWGDNTRSTTDSRGSSYRTWHTAPCQQCGNPHQPGPLLMSVCTIMVCLELTLVLEFTSHSSLAPYPVCRPSERTEGRRSKRRKQREWQQWSVFQLFIFVIPSVCDVVPGLTKGWETRESSLSPITTDRTGQTFIVSTTAPSGQDCKCIVN